MMNITSTLESDRPLFYIMTAVSQLLLSVPSDSIFEKYIDNTRVEFSYISESIVSNRDLNTNPRYKTISIPVYLKYKQITIPSKYRIPSDNEKPSTKPELYDITISFGYYDSYRFELHIKINAITGKIEPSSHKQLQSDLNRIEQNILFQSIINHETRMAQFYNDIIHILRILSPLNTPLTLEEFIAQNQTSITQDPEASKELYRKLEDHHHEIDSLNYLYAIRHNPEKHVEDSETDNDKE